jgi:hypothetical protein
MVRLYGGSGRGTCTYSFVRMSVLLSTRMVRGSYLDSEISCGADSRFIFISLFPPDKFWEAIPIQTRSLQIFSNSLFTK